MNKTVALVVLLAPILLFAAAASGRAASDGTIPSVESGTMHSVYHPNEAARHGDPRLCNCGIARVTG